MGGTVIIIADSLTNDFLSPAEQFLKTKVNVGVAEINRLMGREDEFGRGPLPTFLRSAVRMRRGGAPVHLLFLRDLHDPADPAQMPEMLRFGPHDVIGTPGAEFLEHLRDLVPDVTVVDTPALSLPAEALVSFLRSVLGKDPFRLTFEEKQSVSFILVGVHTEIRVLQNASLIRNHYGFQNVFVCPQLIGSRNVPVHEKALQVFFPDALVEVVSQLEQVARLVGFPPEILARFETGDCIFEPAEFFESLRADQQRVLRHMFLFHSRIRLKTLSGGYSGSFLFLVDGEKRGAATAHVIVKLGTGEAIRRELKGYSEAKPFLGQHIPTCDLPVSFGSASAIRMDLASMEGHPETLQELFELGETSEGFGRFLAQLEKCLGILRRALFQNLRRSSKACPYREFGLQLAQQKRWLRENIGHILGGFREEETELMVGEGIRIPNFVSAFDKLVGHVDRLPGEFSLCHGDLNLANILSDGNRNIWIIDWFFAEERPLEHDFAKLENDLKFVVPKCFSEKDLPHLDLFERFLLERTVLPDLPALPDELAFVRDDARFGKLYLALQVHRKILGSLDRDDRVPWYQLALLKFAVHTLSFDRRRGRGECDLPQLKHALLTVARLVRILGEHPIHRFYYRDAPDSYPQRIPVPMERKSWQISWPEYNPPRFVEPLILERSRDMSAGWVDPDDHRSIPDLSRRQSFSGPLRLDEKGFPLFPLGRTGVAGRGFFGRWGPNHAVDPIVARLHPRSGELQVAFVKRIETGQWALPGGIVNSWESPEEAAGRSLKDKIGLVLKKPAWTTVTRMVVEDYRNTDNSWFESVVLFILLSQRASKTLSVRSTERFSDADWITPGGDFSRTLFANHAAMIIQALHSPEVRGLIPLPGEALDLLADSV